MDRPLDPADPRIDALVATAAAGVDCDGLVVGRDARRYRVETPENTRDGLDERGLRRVAAEHPRYVSNWHVWTREVDGSAERAFLRWLERADALPVPGRYARLAEGLAREWGELRLSATVADDGRRCYEARHRADADRPRDALAVHRDPYEARELVRYDERGRYRPLKTAPTLRRGWALADLGPEALVRAVDLVYPATIHNWHRERRGQLDVTHWREAAGRQTGIYDVVSELPDEAVAWLAEACCVDSQCLKRREWDLDGETALGVDRGDGTFPCREPCSLVVAAAREFALAERDDRGDVELSLGAADAEQLGAVVDAVAEDRIDEVREGDVGDPANRYRVRYRRAKHGDEFDGPGRAGEGRASVEDPAPGTTDEDGSAG